MLRRRVARLAPGSVRVSGTCPASTEPGQPAEASWPAGFAILAGSAASGRHAGSGAGCGALCVAGLAGLVGVKPAGRGVTLHRGTSIAVSLGGLLPCCGLFPCGAGLPFGYLGLAAVSAGVVHLGLLPLLAGELAAPLQLAATDQRDCQGQQRNYDDHANDDPGDRSGIQTNTSSVGNRSCP